VLGRTVRQARDPMDVNLRGVALLAGLALRELRLEELPARVPFAASFEPRREHAATYDELFAAFRRIYRANRRLYARLNRPGRTK
jgi:xylulokinase